MDFTALLRNITVAMSSNGSVLRIRNGSVEDTNAIWHPLSLVDLNRWLLESKVFPTWRFSYIYHVMIAMAVLVTTLNAYISCICIRQSKLRRKSNLCLAHLALIDIIVGTVCIPLFVMSQKRMEDATFSSYVCALQLYTATKVLIHATSLLTISNLFLIIADRLFSVKYPLKHMLYVTRLRIAVIMACIWGVSLAYTALSLVIYWPTFKAAKMTGLSSILALFSTLLRVSMHLEEYKLNEIYYSLVVLLTIVSIIFIVFIFLAVHRRPLLTDSTGRAVLTFRRRREFKAVKILSLMVLTMIVWLAPTVFGFIGDNDKLNYVALYLGRFAISLTNPVLFTLYKNDFWQAMKQDFILVVGTIGKHRRCRRVDRASIKTS